MLILLFVADEMSFDRYYQNAGHLVRIVLKGKVNGEVISEAITPAPVAKALKDELPEVIAATRLRRVGSPKIVYNRKPFRNTRVAFVDPNFFDLFTLPVVQGDKRSWLTDPQTVVITRPQARRFFGDEDPIGKLIDIESHGQQFRVTGVIEEVPANTHFHFDVFASLSGVREGQSDSWMASNYFTYVLLQEGSDVAAFEAKLPAVVAKFMGPQISQMGMTFDKFKANGNEIGLYAQRVLDIHLHSDIGGPTELEVGGDIRLVYIFTLIAVFMLLIACINFMNLSTAAAGRRLKEIGVKKVLGSQRHQLIVQFMGEAFIASSLAMAVGLIISLTALPLFNELTGKNLSMRFLWQPHIATLFFILIVFVTVLAGAYPALFLSSMKPLSALRNKIMHTGSSRNVRSVLVIFQVAVSAGLVFCVITVSRQISFIANKDIGYEREHVLVLRESYLLGGSEQAFRNQLLSDTRVESITRSAFVPAGPTDDNLTNAYARQLAESVRRVILYQVDDQYIPVLGLKLIAGRNFSAIPSIDSTHVILNEMAAHIFGLGNDPVGQTLTTTLGKGGSKRDMTVIGVVRDFHFRSMHEQVAPLMMVNNPYGGMILRVKTDDMPTLLRDIESRWKVLDAGEPFSYAMLNALYNETYVKEQRTATGLELFGVLTIFVACLGLFGLVTFNTDQRVKEIGVRKVLGASVVQIVSLLSRDLVVLVAVSFLIAFPVGYFVMTKWLQGFAYRVDMTWWVPVAAGVITLAVAFFTMSFKTVRSALANPTRSLRSE